MGSNANISITDNLSPATVERLQQFPANGGRHDWMIRTLGGLKTKLSREQAVRYLTKVRHSGGMDDFPDHEIAGIVDYCYETESDARPARKTPRWPKANPETIQRVLEKVVPCFDVKVEEDLNAWQAMKKLYHADDLVCMGRDVYRAEVRTLSDWKLEAAEMQFVVPNPMRFGSAKRKDGKEAVRCQANVRKRRYLISEFDNPELCKEQQARLLTALGTVCTLKLVVDSGGKSLHGWFGVEHLNSRDLAQYFCKCCLLGADPAMWNSCSWVRVPSGLRKKTGREPVRQRILYLASEIGGAV